VHLTFREQSVLSYPILMNTWKFPELRENDLIRFNEIYRQNEKSSKSAPCI